MRSMKKRFACLFLTAQLLIGWLAPCAAASGAVFTDVKLGKWYYNDITEMADAGWLAGYGDGTFRPGRTITRAEFVSIVARRAGLSPVPARTGHWASGMVAAALEKGWYDWGELPPTGETYDKPISRQVAVKVLMRAFLPNASGDYLTESRKIKDFSQVDGRYYDTLLAAYAEGIAAGDPDGSFRPRSGLSRAEACALICRAARKLNGEAPIPDLPGGSTGPDKVPAKGGVKENGKLQVKGTQLCNEAGNPVVLRGMSTHGMQWYGNFASSGAIRSTASFGANLFRVAMYTGENGYLSQPKTIKQKVISAVDAAIANDMYVIIDWHILSDGNPKDHLREAKAFFADMAKRYKDEPAVLYELCNEPNGNVSWAGDVKPYAEELVKTIRGAGSDGVILIGSPTWSQDIHLAAGDPVKGRNLMYTLHFYAGTHGESLRQRIDSAMKQGLPVFVSEWGVSRADGSGGVFLREAGEWLDFLEKRGISWANWSLCDKNETSAALKPGASSNGNWTQSDLTESGKFVFSRFG